MAFQRESSVHTTAVGPLSLCRVWKAVNVVEERIAACKVIRITEATTDKERKTFEKEMRVHSALKHTNVLEFYTAVVVELKHQLSYHPGIYILLELAAGGDLFDKIGAQAAALCNSVLTMDNLEPDVGVSDAMAHMYFQQLVAGMVRQRSIAQSSETFSSISRRSIFTSRVFATEISSLKTYSSIP